ncbi:hypothetical protein RhiJN_15771 [Ceratobasidium sp. AG-Ba]|nr:hypothetical protein RhiJN_15771 [Ceratobasidium sp. AG-Ba]
MAPNSPKTLDLEDDIDPETIQSMADVSFSLALNMVQSWMPPASSSTPLDPSIAESRKKLEEYMRRPPGLGVGAPLPSSAAQNQQKAMHHETQRFKNRLVGSGAARRRAEDAKLNGSSTNNKSDEDEEDESESRATATPKVVPQSQPQAVICSPPPPSTPTRSSTSSGREATPTKPPSPSQSTEPMGVHTLPPKFPLATRVWTRPNGTPSSSPVGSDRTQAKRRKAAPMLPPTSAPELGWNMQLPASRSPSVSASVSSQAHSAVGAATDLTDKSGEEQGRERAQTGPSSLATPPLSRKERKRLRREAAQQAGAPEKPLAKLAPEAGPDEAPSGVETPSTDLDRGRDAQPSSAHEAQEDDSESSDDDSEGVSRIRENGT